MERQKKYKSAKDVFNLMNCNKTCATLITYFNHKFGINMIAWYFLGNSLGKCFHTLIK